MSCKIKIRVIRIINPFDKIIICLQNYMRKKRMHLSSDLLVINYLLICYDTLSGPGDIEK